MRKQQLMELKVGDKVISKKDNSISTVTAIGDKVELSNDKQYSESTMIRWWSVVEPVDLIQPQDTQDNNEDDQLHEDNDTNVPKDIVEGDTVTNSTEQTNTVQPTIQQRNLMTDISNLVDLHGANLVQRKEYIGVYKEGYKGCIAMIRRAKYGGLHIDMKQKIWNALDEDYKKVVSKEHYTGIYDKSRRLQRIGYVNDLSILEVIICTALKVA